jgi:acyl carrier protein
MGKTMGEASFLELVKEILELDTEAVTMDSTLDDLGWDSLSNISLIAAVDEQTGKVVSPGALKACSTVADLYSLV